MTAVPCESGCLRFQSPPQATVWVYFQAPFVVLAFVSATLQWRCSSWCFAAALISNLIVFLWHYPILVDMDNWALYTDIACIAFVLIPGSTHVDASHVVTTQMIWFYLASGFWKINTSALNPQISCSGGFLVLLLCGWLPKAWHTDTLISATVHLGPHITAIVELAIPICLYTKFP